MFMVSVSIAEQCKDEFLDQCWKIILSWLNYGNVLVDIVKDAEMKAQIIREQAILNSVKLYFDCQLGERLLSQADNLSCTLQNRALSTMDAISLVDVVIKTLEK